MAKKKSEGFLDDLMEKGGKYNLLFTTQAKRYIESAEVDAQN